MNDIGLTAKQSALINTITGLISLIGPLIFGPIAYRYQKYNLIICVTLLLSTISYTSLLFVPRVIKTAKHSSIIFDCTSGELLVERCQNWENNCSLHPKRLAWDSLAITLTNDFDSIYGRASKLLAITLPMSLWPVGSGILSDYFSLVSKRPDYSPIFVIYDESSSTSSSSMKFKQKICLFALLPFVLFLGSTWGLLYNYLPAYYLELGIDKTWLSLAFSLSFIGYAPFCLIIKSLTAGIGRIRLIVLAFIFYAIRLTGISFLHHPRWTIIPFQLMEAFTLPLAWVGITSTIHRLLPSSAAGSHLIVQYSLVIIHFGLGRSFGAFIWWLWLQDWEVNHDRWNWLIYDWPLIQIAANYDVSSYRLLLRLTAIIMAICGLVLLLFYHLCCFCCSPKRSSIHQMKTKNNRIKGKHNKSSSPSNSPSTSTGNQSKKSNETDVLLNGIHSSSFTVPSADNNQLISDDCNKLITMPKTLTADGQPIKGETNGVKVISKVGEDDL
uniref:Major facilitator superfamily associated domain-containing protein n=1 Tax=Tetranychus urticae TaxID=32264 RepID=T1L394_TETUR